MPEVKWEAESLRATAFYNIGNTPQDVTQLWMLLMHREPRQVSIRPTEGLHVAEGPFGGNEKQLQCAIRPERVDWVLRAAPPPPNQPLEGLATIGPLEGVLPPFQDLSIKWLEKSSAITRLAFGAALFIETDNLQDAGTKLASLLSSANLDPTDASDFLYRVNRRRPLGSVPGALVNRINTWSIIRGESIGFAASGDAPPQLTRLTAHTACRLELDVSNVGCVH